MAKNKKKHKSALNFRGKKILPQTRIQLNELVDQVLQKCTTFAPQNPKQECEEYREIYKILQKICVIEKEYMLPLPVRQNHWEGFLAWCKQHGTQSDKVTIQPLDKEEYGIVAKSELKEGEVFLTVPRDLIISSTTAKKSKLGPLLEKDAILQEMPNVVLALHLLLEYFDPESFWQPYLSILPAEYNTPLYFTCEELEELQGSPALEETVKTCRNIARQYAHFYKTFQSNPAAKSLLLKDFFTYDFYRWAVSTVMTRQNSVPTPDGASRIQALIPLWDMCNHVNGIVSTDFNVEKNQLECFAMKNVNAGEQVCIFYGVRSNAEFFIHNGFVCLENPHDSIVLKLGMSKSDPLFTQKSQLCKQLGLPVTGKFHLHAGHEPVEKRLLAYLRVQVIKDDDILKINEEQNFDWLLNEDIQSTDHLTQDALVFLKTRITLLLRAYPTTLEDDEKLLQNEELSSRRHLAIMLRLTEKRILSSAFQYLINISQS
ncbi:actin-histidine N-methyltransferase-like isoform X2 [Tachypleus tridentatus]